MIERTCGGGCCAVFWLPKEVPDNIYDAAFIRDMRIELTAEQAQERWAKFVGDGRVLPPAEPERPWYTCRHWDEDTRLCTVYEQRPMLCRDYPYGRPCSHGCDYQIAEPEVLARYEVKP
jgi:Fe-S-cluster containining protein